MRTYVSGSSVLASFALRDSCHDGAGEKAPVARGEAASPSLGGLGIVLVALVVGLLVRLAARSRGARPTVTVFVVGILAALSLVESRRRVSKSTAVST